MLLYCNSHQFYGVLYSSAKAAPRAPLTGLVNDAIWGVGKRRAIQDHSAAFSQM